MMNWGFKKPRNTIGLILLIAGTAGAQEFTDYIRSAVTQNNFALADSFVKQYREQAGVTPELIDGIAWIARGYLTQKDLDRADTYATQARTLALEQLAHRKLDAEPHLPQALGAAIEVQARVMAARGESGEAVAFLRREIKTYWNTTIRARLQQNINLLSLEGKTAPALDVSHWVGPKPAPLERLRGKPVILFFWAHWCSDCKKEAPDLAQVAALYAKEGLVVVGPTQHYGYVARGEEAPPQQETAYIDSVRKEFYSMLATMPAPVSEENFRNYGASTSPTLVFIDRKGIVRVYHPGAMSYAELVAAAKAIVGD
jgi:thiol-disulfide isomerase/thioredoxin